MPSLAVQSILTGLAIVLAGYAADVPLPDVPDVRSWPNMAKTAMSNKPVRVEDPHPFAITRDMRLVYDLTWPMLKSLPRHIKNLPNKAQQAGTDFMDTVADNADAFAEGVQDKWTNYTEAVKDKAHTFGKHVPDQWAAQLVCTILVAILFLILLALSYHKLDLCENVDGEREADNDPRSRWCGIGLRQTRLCKQTERLKPSFGGKTYGGN